MNEMKKLLQGSIKEFEDKANNTKATGCTYLTGANGLSYIMPGDTNEEISCSFHVSTEQVQRVDGIYNVAIVEVNTQKDIFANFIAEATTLVLLEYKGLKISVNKSSAYNEKAGTFHYFGEVIQSKNSGYIITDDDIASQLFLSNSTARWIEFGTWHGVSVYPSFLTPTNKDLVHCVVEIKRTESPSVPYQSSDTKVLQYMHDDVTLHLINATLNEAQDFSLALMTQAEAKGYFGLMLSPKWSQVQDDTQSSFGIKANKRRMELKINYTLESTAESALKYIKHATANIALAEIGD